jgi:hypothetical protein
VTRTLLSIAWLKEKELPTFLKGKDGQSNFRKNLKFQEKHSNRHTRHEQCDAIKVILPPAVSCDLQS